MTTPRRSTHSVTTPAESDSSSTASPLQTTRTERERAASALPRERVPEDALFRFDRKPSRQIELLRTIMDHIPIMLTCVDASGRVRWINREWERVLGWSLEEVQHLDVLAEAYPDPVYRETVIQYLRAAAPGWRDFTVRRKDGDLIETSWAIERLSDGTLIGIGQDITHRKRVEEDLRTSREQLRKLVARAGRAIEHERTELARELHDQLGQFLTTLTMDLAWIGQRLPSGTPEATSIVEKTADMRQAITSAIQRVRRISAGLRPITLDRLGLLATIEWQVEEFERRTGIRCRFDCRVDHVELGVDRATQIFRIAQEAMTNAARHAGATRVTLVARKRQNAFRLETRDNGRGISDEAIADPGALGLLGMRERALLAGGALTIGRAGRKGTVVIVTIPLAKRSRPSVNR